MVRFKKSKKVEKSFMTFDEVLNSDISNNNLFRELDNDGQGLYKEYLNTVVVDIDNNKRMHEALKKRVCRVVLNYKAGLVYLNTMVSFIVKLWAGARGDALNLLLDFFDVAINEFWSFGIQMSVLEEWHLKAWWSFYKECVKLNNGGWVRNTMTVKKTPHEATVRRLGGFGEDGYGDDYEAF